MSYKVFREISRLNSSLIGPEDFMNAYQTTTPQQKKLLYEFYLHNYVIPYNPQWNPLLAVGDIHLKATMSYIQNENNKGEKGI